MKKQPQFFFDTADIQYIQKAWEMLKANGFSATDVVGITSNPNALTKVNCTDMAAFNKHVPAMCEAITKIREGQKGGVVYVQFPQMTMSEDSMRKYVKHIVGLSDGVTKVGLKIPPYAHVLKLVDEFNELVDTNVTGVSDCGTALKCATYNVRYVSILTGRMEEVGINAREQVQYMLHGNLGKTEILTASMRTMECIAWGIEEMTVPTIGTRVFDQIFEKGSDAAKQLRAMWDNVKTDVGMVEQKKEFSPLITQNMTDLSLSFFEQMDKLGEPLRKSFES